MYYTPEYENKGVRSEGQSTSDINDLIDFLTQQRDEGATTYQVDVSRDPSWPDTWIRTYRKVPKEELKEIKIKELEDKIKKLKEE